MALSDVSLPCDGMSAIGATTDIGQTWGLDASVENDPKRTSGAAALIRPRLWAAGSTDRHRALAAPRPHDPSAGFNASRSLSH